MKVIPHNPYIVGNPIKTKEMFFGREDDFQYVIKKIGAGKTNQIIVFCGDRRSGKTSILFQILSGQLGEKFLPILIDMQILAGIKKDEEFFQIILKRACSSLDDPEINFDIIKNKAPEEKIQRLFDTFFDLIKKKHKNKIILFLFDEYELIEAKIKNGLLTESIIQYLSGILESSYSVSFIFTGSTNLEKRNVDYWKILLGKSLYKKISYLSRQDCYRLITEPLRDYISYPKQVKETIYRLTSGQPFYTQVICQNIVDLLIEEQRDDPNPDDIKQIVKDIVDNPLPQMIYSWNSLEKYPRLGLAVLSSILKHADDWRSGSEAYQFLKKSKVALDFKKENINVILEQAYHKEFLEKNDVNNYRFKMDLFRQWIKKEHSIWKVIKEVGLELKKPVRLIFISAAIAIPVVLGIFLFFRFVIQPATRQLTEDETAISTGGDEAVALQVENIKLQANQGPFRVVIDDTWNFTSEGLADNKIIPIPSLEQGEHRFVFHNITTNEEVEITTTVTESTQIVTVEFEKAQVASSAGGASKDRGSGQQIVEQKSELGAIFITTEPAGASIIIQGEDTGLKTPNIIDSLKGGEYSVALQLEGHKTQSLIIGVENGKTTRREIVLEISYGQLQLDVRPTAKIYFDGEFLIETPYVKPIEVPAGKHQITIKNELLKVEKSITVEIKEGQKIQISEILE